MSAPIECMSCHGTGELPTDYGPADCPDCGGSGTLPSHAVLVEWRMRDLERSLARGEPRAPDVQWLLHELRTARSALTDVVALAQEMFDAPLGERVHGRAVEALGLYEKRAR